MLKKLQTKHAGFTLVEIMIVVAIIALLAAIAVPGFLRARKRSQASKILNDLRLIDGAVDQYAIETGRKSGDVVGKTGKQLFITGNRVLKSGNPVGKSGNRLCMPGHHWYQAWADNGF